MNRAERASAEKPEEFIRVSAVTLRRFWELLTNLDAFALPDTV